MKLPLTPHKREILTKWLQGYTIQYLYKDQWEDCEYEQAIHFSHGDEYYRVKPQEEKRVYVIFDERAFEGSTANAEKLCVTGTDRDEALSVISVGSYGKCSLYSFVGSSDLSGSGVEMRWEANFHPEVGIVENANI